MNYTQTHSDADDEVIVTLKLKRREAARLLVWLSEAHAATAVVETGPAVHEPAARERIRDASAAGQAQLAEKRAAAAATTPVKATKKEKAKAAETVTRLGTEDAAGDREDGDTTNTPDDEPADPLGAGDTETATSGRTPTQMRDAIVAVLRPIHAKNQAGKSSVLALCKHFGVSYIHDVPDDRTGELWTMTEALCRKFGVPFVDEATEDML